MHIFKLSAVLAMTILLVAGVVQAAPSGVASITKGIDNPGRIAVDVQGNLYVTEAAKNVVKKFSSKSRYLTSLNVSRPLGIAVDASDLLYVGSEGDKRVNVYDAALTFVRSIGTDIQKPNSVAVDASGMVYVTDSLRNLVNVYDAAGNRVSFVWGAALRKPMGVAVNDAAGEIYVVDVPKLATANGDTDGTRIVVFNKTGAYQRTIGQSVGQQAKYTEVAYDKAGTLYVTDGIANVFLFNSATGAAQGTLSGSVKGLFNPKGIAISQNGMVYVASYSGKSIEVLALDGSVTMDVDPLSLTFSATQYAGNPDPQTIVIANTGSGTLNWSASADKDWIVLGKQDPVGPKSAGSLAVGVNSAAFGVGTYTGTITIDSGFGQTQAVGITVVVGPAPFLNISNGWLNFTAKKGTTPAAQGITLSVDNLSRPVSWSITSNSPWLTAAPASGTISSAALTGAASVSVNTAGLSVGSYSGILTVSAPGVVGTGQITVILKITPSTKISVSTNRIEATFSISGPANYKGSGAAWSVEDVPAGDYTVTFDAVTGYKKPLPQTKSLAGDGEVTFGGIYNSWQDLAAKKNIVVAKGLGAMKGPSGKKGSGAKDESLVKAYKNNGTPVALDLAALSTSSGANVAVGDVDGDGVAELIIGAGDGVANPATVRVFENDGSQVLEFVPFGSLNGVRVAAADLNGDGIAEIIVSPAGGADNAGKVVVYTYDAAKKKMVTTGIEFTAYTAGYGANLAAADIDGNGKPVIVTAPGSGKQNTALVKLWKVDATAAVGSWTATLLKDISLGGAYGATVAAGDVDGDGKDEVIIGTSGDNAMVTIVKSDGSRSGFKAFDKNMVNVAAADLDGDGNADIIAAQGSSGIQTKTMYGGAEQERGVVRVFDASGNLSFTITPFEGAQEGINVAVGDLGI